MKTTLLLLLQQTPNRKYFIIFRNLTFKLTHKERTKELSAVEVFYESLFRYCAVPKKHESHQYTFQIAHCGGLKPEDVSTADDVWINKDQ